MSATLSLSELIKRLQEQECEFIPHQRTNVVDVERSGTSITIVTEEMQEDDGRQC